MSLIVNLLLTLWVLHSFRNDTAIPIDLSFELPDLGGPLITLPILVGSLYMLFKRLKKVILDLKDWYLTEPETPLSYRVTKVVLKFTVRPYSYGRSKQAQIYT